MRKLLGVIIAVSVLAISLQGAEALNLLKRNAARGCAMLVTVDHPEMKGDKRRAEIAKCNADAEAYNKSN